MPRVKIGAWRNSVHVYLIVGLIVSTALLGGSSRPDAASILMLRPVVVLLIGGLLLVNGPFDRAAIRLPLIALGLFAATMAVQLIPLPPGLWLALPGHEQFTASIPLAGPAMGWRPISLYPDMTLNALIALLPAAAAILGYARLTPQQRPVLLTWLVLAAAASAGVGLVQILGGGDSPAYLYQHTSLGLPVGLLANRNHQAVFLALGLLPMAVWGFRGSAGTMPRSLRMTLALGGILLFLPVIILTGSRSGLVMACLALLLLPWVLRVNLKRHLGRQRSQIVTYVAIALAILVVAVIGYMVSSNQAMSINRLLDTNELRAEKRILAAPVMTQMLRDFLPFGLGHGAFEPTFRTYEPDILLTPTYFNRAHNDWLELAMSGGVPTILVMLAFLGWFGRRVVAQIRSHDRSQPTIYARMGAAIILILALASITDYPVRPPFLTVVFTLACLWLQDGDRRFPEPAMDA